MRKKARRGFLFLLIVAAICTLMPHAVLASEVSLSPLNVEWSDTVGSPNDQYADMTALGPTNVVAVGYHDPTASAFITNHTTSGELVWHVGVPRSLAAGLGAVDSVSPDKGIFVAGYSQTGSYSYGMVGKYDQNGSLLWSRYYPGTYIARYGDVIALADGGCLVVGCSRVFNWNEEGVICRYDAEGNTVWVKRAGNSTAGIQTYFNRAAQDNDGGFIVLGTSSGGNESGSPSWQNRGSILVKYSEQGEVLWSKNIPSGLAVSSCQEGGVIIGGEVSAFSSQRTLTKYSSNGLQEWSTGTASFMSPYPGTMNITQANGGTFLVGGSTYLVRNPALSDLGIAVAKYSSTGSLLWAGEKDVVGAPDYGEFEEFSWLNKVIEVAPGEYIAAGRGQFMSYGEEPDIGGALIFKFSVNEAIYSYNIEYRLRSEDGPVIDTITVDQKHLNEEILLDSGSSFGQLNYLKPANRFADGVQGGPVPARVSDPPTTIVVYYPYLGY